MKILIWAPDYNHRSGGNRALHRLAWLACESHNVLLAPGALNPEWGQYSAKGLRAHDCELAIVPEVFTGKLPENITTVRWCLYHPGVLGGLQTFGPDEQVWAFHRRFEESSRKACPDPDRQFCGTFFLPNAELPGLHHEYERNIRSICFVGKGPRISGLPIHEISRWWPHTRLDLVRTLKRTRTFYCTDPDTALLAEADRCGCEVKLWNKEKAAWEIWLPTAEDYEIFPPAHELEVERVNNWLKACALNRIVTDAGSWKPC